MRISDWSSDVCSSDLPAVAAVAVLQPDRRRHLEEFDQLPLQPAEVDSPGYLVAGGGRPAQGEEHTPRERGASPGIAAGPGGRRVVRHRRPRHSRSARSDEHTSELQSLMRLSYAVFCLKKKNNRRDKHVHK